MEMHKTRMETHKTHMETHKNTWKRLNIPKNGPSKSMKLKRKLSNVKDIRKVLRQKVW